MLKDKKPEISLSCNIPSKSCNFQFWAAQRESFFCELNECETTEQKLGGVNSTETICKNMNCRCFPGRLLCDSTGLDLTDWMESEDGPIGPGTISCTDKYENGELERLCTINEANMNTLITQFFGDPNIDLSCPIAGECVSRNSLPDHSLPPFEPHFSNLIIGLMISGGFGLVIGVVFIMQWFASRSEEGAGAYTPIASNEEAFFERHNEMMHNHSASTLMFQDLSYSIDNQKLGISSSTSHINVLHNVQGLVRPGEVLAIMGGSGAGKTTFLDILARKNKAGTVSGDVLVNGKFVNYDAYRNIIGYVDQEDTLMPTLTVYETILYSALLRLPRTMSWESKKQRVQDTMLELNILSIANRRIGSTGQRGLSGGEKRRVSIACELVTSPSILFLDEPTSGLDAYNAYNVIESLVTLARDFQRTIVFTIHQPRSNIYALFDQLVLLAKGYVVYSGPAQQPVLDHFMSIGYNCPNGFNIGDYLVDLTMHACKIKQDANEGQEDGDLMSHSLVLSEISAGSKRPNVRDVQESALYSPKSHDMSHNATPVILAANEFDGNQVVDGVTPELKKLIDGYSNSGLSKAIRSEIRNSLLQNYPVSDMEAIGRARARSGTQTRMSLQLNQSFENLISSSGHSRPSWWTQFTILSGRTFKNLVRNPDLLLTHYAISVFVALVSGFLFWKVDNTLAGFQNRLGVMFFITAVFAFSCLSSMQIFASERLVFLRERANRYYAPITYFTSKVFIRILTCRLFLICSHYA